MNLLEQVGSGEVLGMQTRMSGCESSSIMLSYAFEGVVAGVSEFGDVGVVDFDDVTVFWADGDAEGSGGSLGRRGGGGGRVRTTWAGRSWLTAVGVKFVGTRHSGSRTMKPRRRQESLNRGNFLFWTRAIIG